MTGESILSVFFPELCHICGARLSEGEKGICAVCNEALPRTFFHQRPMNPMEQRISGLFPFERAAGLFFYSRESSVAQLVQDIKYRGFPRLAVRMGEIMASELLATGFFADIDYLVPVPLHFFKRLRRGYNQTEKLAQGVSRITGIPVSDSLKATRGHSTQTALSHSKRWKNMKGVFSLQDNSGLEGSHILLIDDICTTGATMISAASAISGALGSVKISALTFGVAH